VSVLTIPTPRVFKPLLTPSRYKGAYGGRGSGKSHFFAELAIERSVMEKTDIVCVREIQRTLDQSVKKLIEAKIESLNAGYYFDVQDRRVRSRPTGAESFSGMMIFEGMQDHTADSVKSFEGFDVALVEEAQKLSQRSLDLLRPTIRKPGSELWFAWNPEKETDPVDVLLRGESPPPDAVVVKANYRDNPWLPDVLKAELEYDQKRDPDKFAHIWLGEYQRNSESRVFKNWKIEDFDTPAGATFRLGADWGFSVDPSVLVRCYLEGRRLFVDQEAYMVGCEIDMLPDLFRRVPDAEKWFITADSARPETISYMRKHGFPKINSAIKGPKSLEEGIEFLKSFDIVVHPRCKHTIDELTLYSYEVDKLTGVVLPKLADKHNHVIDSLRYACEGLRRAVVKRPEAAVPYHMPRGAHAWAA
jgi:phage terminase large subunit